MKKKYFNLADKLILITEKYITLPTVYNSIIILILSIVNFYLFIKPSNTNYKWVFLFLSILIILTLALFIKLATLEQKKRLELKKNKPTLETFTYFENKKLIEELEFILSEYFNKKKSTSTLTNLLVKMSNNELYELNSDEKFYFSFNRKIQISNALLYIQINVFNNKDESLRPLYTSHLYSDNDGQKLELSEFSTAKSKFSKAKLDSPIFNKLITLRQNNAMDKVC